MVAKTKANYVSVKEAENLIRNSNGRFITATFIKRSNNELRTMNARIGVHKNLVGIRKSKKGGTGLVMVYDMSKKAYRNINVSGLRALRMNGKTYLVY